MSTGHVMTGHGVTITSLLSMKYRLALEVKGIKFRGQTMYSLIKERYGFKGNKQKVYEQFCAMIDEEAKKLKPGEITSF